MTLTSLCKHTKQSTPQSRISISSSSSFDASSIVAGYPPAITLLCITQLHHGVGPA
jgi:hypothetical protein